MIKGFSPNFAISGQLIFFLLMRKYTMEKKKIKKKATVTQLTTHCRKRLTYLLPKNALLILSEFKKIKNKL